MAVRRRVAWALLVPLLIAARAAWALDPAKRVAEMTQDVWQVQHGLPQDSVREIAQSADGYLWLSTMGGVARFDGMTFTRVQPAAVPELRAERYARLLPARDGGMWVTAENVVAHFRDGRWTKAATLNDLAQSLYEDGDGALWIGTYHGSVVRLVRGQLQPPEDTSALTGRPITTIHRDHAGRLWLGSETGLAIHDGTRFVPYRDAGPASRTWVRSIVDGSQGRILVASSGGLVVMQGGAYTVHAPTGAQSATEDADGNIWIGTSRGLLRLRDGEVVAAGVVDGLPDEGVVHVFQDRERSLWLGTYGGLVRLTDRTLPIVVPTKEQVNTVCEDGAGALWVGTNGALLEWRGGAATDHTREVAATPPVFRAVVPGGRDEIYVGTASGVYRLHGGTAEPVVIAGQRFAQGAKVLHRGPSGAVWVVTGTDALVARLDGDQARLLTPAEGLPRTSYAVVFEDRSGRLWLGGPAGLVRYDGRSFTMLGRKDGLTGNQISTIVQDARRGELWFGTRAGEVIRLRNDRFEWFGAAHGLPDYEIHQMLELNGDLWLSTYRGLLRIPESSFDDVAAGRAVELSIASYRFSERRRSIVGTGRTLPAGWKGHDGLLYFATRDGVVAVGPRPAPRNDAAPPVSIERVLVDHQDVPMADSVRVPPGARFLALHFGALSLVEPQRIRYQARLVGFDDAWRSLGDQRIAEYNDLRPGRYTFQVRAANNDGLWNLAGAALALEVAPRFTQTPWFYLSCALVLAAALGLLYRLRLGRLRVVYEAVLAERTRLARELHDRLLQGLTAISWQLESAAHKHASGPDAARRHLDVAQTMLAESLAEARRFVWDLRPQVTDRSDLGAALSGLVARLGEGAAARMTFSSDGAPSALSNAVKENLLAATKEALSNALKHAQATRVEVRLAYKPEAVELHLSDDGRGFDTAAAPPAGHFGLIGLRERAAAIGATLTVDSRPGGGTRIALVVPSSKDART